MKLTFKKVKTVIYFIAAVEYLTLCNVTEFISMQLIIYCNNTLNLKYFSKPECMFRFQKVKEHSFGPNGKLIISTNGDKSNKEIEDI